MPLAFTDAADLSGISGRQGLSIHDLVHQTFVDVDEAGTQAAAASATGFTTTGAYLPAKIHFDHPYLFLVRDGGTGAIVFMGRVEDPTLRAISAAPERPGRGEIVLVELVAAARVNDVLGLPPAAVEHLGEGRRVLPGPLFFLIADSEVEGRARLSRQGLVDGCSPGAVDAIAPLDGEKRDEIAPVGTAT